MTKEELLEFIQEKLHSALWGGDLENGVAWLNREAADKFYKEYPYLSKAIGEIIHMEIKDD